VCVFDSLALVGRQDYLEGRAFGFHHAPGKTTHNLESFLVDIHQPELVERELFQARQETVYQLGRIGRAAADHRNFEHPIYQPP
jgi:hypothetical protein